MEKKDMVQALVDHYSMGNKAQFASILGIKPQTINSWIARNTFDSELIFANCVDISAEWLLTGRGEMLKSSSGVSMPTAEELPTHTGVTPEILSELLNRITEQAEEIGLLKARIQELERGKGKSVSDAPTSDIANVG